MTTGVSVAKDLAMTKAEELVQKALTKGQDLAQRALTTGQDFAAAKVEQLARNKVLASLIDAPFLQSKIKNLSNIPQVRKVLQNRATEILNKDSSHLISSRVVASND